MEENLSDEVETDDASKIRSENNNCEEKMMKTRKQTTERDHTHEEWETRKQHARTDSNTDTHRERIKKTRQQKAENKNENDNNSIEESRTPNKNSTERDDTITNRVWKENDKQYAENIHEERKGKEYPAEINHTYEDSIRKTSKQISELRKKDVHRDDARANGIAIVANHFIGNLENDTNTFGHNIIERNDILGHNHCEANTEESGQNYSEANYGIRSTVSQITATLILNFLNFNYGMVVTMPTLLVGTLDNATALNGTRLDSPQLILNEQQASWLGSILMLFHPVGALLAGHIQESMGRKHIMFSINIPFLICWFLLYSAQHVYILYIACIVMGISLGCCEAPVASYIGEISEPKLRGAISLLTGFASSIGALVIYVLYTYTSWRVTFLLSAIIPSISLSVIGFLPESPVFLVSKNRPEDARKSLRWLRGWLTTEDPNSESMKSIEGELKQLIAITNETNTLYINTKVKHRGSILADISHRDGTLDNHSDVVVNCEQTCLIMENIKFNERVPDNEAVAYNQGYISHHHNHGGYHENSSQPREEYGIESICQKSKCHAKDVEGKESKCDVEYLHRNSETLHSSEMKFNRKYSNSQLMKERKNNENNNFFRHPIPEEQSNNISSQTSKERKRVKQKAPENDIPEEPSYHIVKVKHEKTMGNLVRYTVRNEEIRRPLIMVLTVMTITTIASLSPIRPFLMEIIQTYDDQINTDDVLIGTCILNILGFFLCAVSINRLGKRRLAILSLSINAVVSFTLGYFAYKHVPQSRIPIYCIYINSFLQGYGILQLPWILMSEVFPLEIRGLACGLCAGFSYLLNFCFTKTYLSMTSMFGLAFTIYLYSMTGVVGIVYIYFFMPETENKTLHEIQQYFLRKR
uniref:Facilitated trehalose transporter Tret1 n=1 Tax=Cacopsylla melanoneura TaxID=428564 RepID=A0A8D8VNR7_9HEMI